MQGNTGLTHSGLLTPYGDIGLGQHWLRWWLVAWRHQAITWTSVDLSSVTSSGIHLRAISHKIPQSFRSQWVNSLSAERFGCGIRCVDFKHYFSIDIVNIQVNIAREWMPKKTIDHKSMLAQVMAWCCQAPSHYPSQYWASYMSPYGITRSQWVNKILL